MNEIKFSKNYKKLHNQNKATLLWLTVGKAIELHPDFIEYDTEGQYEIKKDQKYILLVFLGINGIPFTSLRKFNDENVRRFVGKENQEFNIVIEEVEKETLSQKAFLDVKESQEEPKHEKEIYLTKKEGLWYFISFLILFPIINVFVSIIVDVVFKFFNK